MSEIRTCSGVCRVSESRRCRCVWIVRESYVFYCMISCVYCVGCQKVECVFVCVGCQKVECAGVCGVLKRHVCSTA